MNILAAVLETIANLVELAREAHAGGLSSEQILAHLHAENERLTISLGNLDDAHAKSVEEANAILKGVNPGGEGTKDP